MERPKRYAPSSGDLNLAIAAARWAILRYGLDRSWAEDISQEIVLRHLASGSTKPFDRSRAFELAREFARTHARGETRRRRRQDCASRGLALSDDADSIALRDEFHVRLAWVLAQLSPVQGRILVARLFDASYHEIECILDVAPQCARAQAYRASRRFRSGDLS